jgi:NAD(P)-dependent dehydrogenase (short-subunit alcohol dehydrogenase family)
MDSRGSGTIIFAGATSAIVGRPGFLALATGKFSLRGLSQVIARELWPRGIHVVHVIIDGGSFYFGQEREEPGTDPEAAATTFLMLHTQAKNAWTHELDLRPWNERFWKHC